jgi:hypothetical protein
VNAKIEFLERSIEEKINARDRAMATMDTRLDGMNEFRDTLRDQSAQFVTRDEYLTGHAGVVRNADAMRIDLSTSAVRIEPSDRAAVMERAQFDKRLDALNEFRVQLQH